MRSLVKADKDGCAPSDFYSTTNHRTFVRHAGQWLQVERQRMDSVVVIEDGRAVCRKLRDIRAGEAIVCGVEGIRVAPEFRERDRRGFAFMTNEISSERRVEAGVARIADMMREVKQSGGRIAVVAGPVLIHTGGVGYFCDLIGAGYVDVLLAGNALAVHDVENALYGTSLGVDFETGKAIEGGHRHHMRAINTICRVGGLRQAVEQGVLKSGRDVRVHPPQRPVRPGRQHPRRRPASRDDDGPDRGAGSLRGDARGRQAGASCSRRCCTASGWGTCCRRGCGWSASTSTRRW